MSGLARLCLHLLTISLLLIQLPLQALYLLLFMCLEFVVLDAVAGRIRLNKMDGAVELVDPGFQASNDTFLPRNRRFELVPTLQNVGRRPLDRHFLMGPVAARN